MAGATVGVEAPLVWERAQTLQEDLLLKVVAPPHDWDSHLKHI